MSEAQKEVQKKRDDMINRFYGLKCQVCGKALQDGELLIIKDGCLMHANCREKI